MHQAFTPCSSFLKPLAYFLYLPKRGVYVEIANVASGKFRLTANPAAACALPDADARTVGLRVVRATGEAVDLRLVAH